MKAFPTSFDFDGKMEKIHIISLGAGVQSSCMALMASHGEISPMPVAAIFADTQSEPQSVYQWLDYLEPLLKFPVVRVSKGNLTEMALKIRTKKDGSGTWAKSVIPTFIKNKDGSRGILQRQCTYDYKVLELIKAAKKLIKKHAAIAASQWIGISTDEARRMKQSREQKISHRWPLIELRMNREDCLRWMESKGYPRPPRSACVYCPYHSDSEWKRLKNEEPQEFLRAVLFEKNLQSVKAKTDNMNGIPFLHSSLKPLDEVDLRSDTDKGQKLFWHECEGMCGN